jgi:hypothetical protein
MFSPLITGLVSWWNLDETSGTRADSHGSNDLTDVNTVGYTDGKIGNAASCITANVEYLQVTDNSSFDFSGGMTIAGWVKQNTATDPSISKDDAGSGREFNWLSGTWYVFDSVSGFETVAASDKKPFRQFNADAMVKGSAISNVMKDTGTVFKINNFAGTVSECDWDLVGLWGRALTPAEITLLYNAGSGLDYPFA